MPALVQLALCYALCVQRGPRACEAFATTNSTSTRPMPLTRRRSEPQARTTAMASCSDVSNAVTMMEKTGGLLGSISNVISTEELLFAPTIVEQSLASPKTPTIQTAARVSDSRVHTCPQCTHDQASSSVRVYISPGVLFSTQVLSMSSLGKRVTTCLRQFVSMYNKKKYISGLMLL